MHSWRLIAYLVKRSIRVLQVYLQNTNATFHKVVERHYSDGVEKRLHFCREIYSG